MEKQKPSPSPGGAARVRDPARPVWVLTTRSEDTSPLSPLLYLTHVQGTFIHKSQAPETAECPPAGARTRRCGTFLPWETALQQEGPNSRRTTPCTSETSRRAKKPDAPSAPHSSTCAKSSDGRSQSGKTGQAWGRPEHRPPRTAQDLLRERRVLALATAVACGRTVLCSTARQLRFN